MARNSYEISVTKIAASFGENYCEQSDIETAQKIFTEYDFDEAMLELRDWLPIPTN
jgi:hypothetical protein